MSFSSCGPNNASVKAARKILLKFLQDFRPEYNIHKKVFDNL